MTFNTLYLVALHIIMRLFVNNLVNLGYNITVLDILYMLLNPKIIHVSHALLNQ